MNLSRIRWAAIILPIGFVTLIELASDAFMGGQVDGGTEHALVITVLAIGAVVFSISIFAMIDRMQQRVVRRNEELSALNAVGLSVTGSDDLRQAVTAAVGHVMRVTESTACEVLIQGHEPAEAALRISLGDAAGLDCLAANRRPTLHADELDDERPAVRIETVPGGPMAARFSMPDEYTIALVPLTVQSRTIGWIRLVGSTKCNLVAGESEPLLSAMGNQLAVAVQAGHLYEDVDRRGKEAQALYELGLKIASLQDTQRVLDSVVEHARRILDVDAAALFLMGEDGEMSLSFSAGPEEAFVVQPSGLPLVPPLSVFRSAGALPTDWPMFRTEYRTSMLSAPLRAGDSVIGALCVANRSLRSFPQRDHAVLHALADMATIAMNNARLLGSERHVAVLEERERISRELHDGSAQALGYLHLRSAATRRSLPNDDIDKIARELDDMSSVAEEAYKDVREAILGLRETISPEEGLMGSLREYLQKFSRQSGIEAEVRAGADELPRFAPEQEIQLLRVVQEALTNVRKHSHANSAWIGVEHAGSEVVVTIGDRGQGFDPERIDNESGFGLATMKERVERVGGTLTIESEKGRGTKVQIRLPTRNGGNHGADSDTAGGRPSAVSQGSERSH